MSKILWEDAVNSTVADSQLPVMVGDEANVTANVRLRMKKSNGNIVTADILDKFVGEKLDAESLSELMAAQSPIEKTVDGGRVTLSLDHDLAVPQIVEYGTTTWADIDFTKNLILRYISNDNTVISSAAYTADDTSLKFYASIDGEAYVIQLLQATNEWSATILDTSETYIATYGATTLAELNALSTDIFVYLKQDEAVYVNSYRSTSEWRFTTIDGDMINEAILKSAGWTEQSHSIPGYYTAGTGLKLADNEFSIDDTVVATVDSLEAKQDKLTAGSGISIDSNTISCNIDVYKVSRTYTQDDLISKDPYYGTYCTSQISVTPGATYRIEITPNEWDQFKDFPTSWKFIPRYYEIGSDTYHNYDPEYGSFDSGILERFQYIRIPDNADRIDLFLKKTATQKIRFTITEVDTIHEPQPDFNSNVITIAHRGWMNGTTPENTVPSYVLSSMHGMKYAETDITTTSDGVIVCIHDDTVDRTSDGTGTVKDMTFEQVRALDFGIKFGTQWTGTKIPTLNEFLVCCRNHSIIPVIELKTSVIWTSEQAQQIVDEVESVGLNDAYFICSHTPYLKLIADLTNKYHFGGLRMDQYEGLKEGIPNRFFMDVDYTLLTDEFENLCKTDKVILGVWTLSKSWKGTVNEFIKAHPYVTMYTCNAWDAGAWLCSRDRICYDD